MTTRRAYRTAAQWAELIEQFNNSNEPEAEFCQRLSVNALTFRKHRYAANAASKRAAGAFVPVQVAMPTATTSSVHVHLRNGVRLELAVNTDPTCVAHLVKALQNES